MKYRIYLILILTGIVLNTGHVFGQKILEFESFIEQIRNKRESDAESLNCYSFTVHREQIIREDTLTTHSLLKGKEYHYQKQPLLRIYESARINHQTLAEVPEPDTLLKKDSQPAFYDENFHRYYTLKDLGTDEINGNSMRHIQFAPLPKSSGLMKGEAWIDPESHGIIKMVLQPHPLPAGMTKYAVEIYNTYDDAGRTIRYGMQSVHHIITSDRKMEIRIRERYTDYEEKSETICDSIKQIY